MTSKSLEALDWLVQYLVPFHFHANPNNTKKINDLLSILKQDLEHKEQSEKENKELKDKLNQEFEDSADQLCKALTERDEYYNELEDLKLILSDVAFILYQVPHCEPEVERLELVDKALDKLKILEKENQELKERQKDILNANVELSFENYKLKKALDKACERLDWDCPVSQELIDDLDCENRCHCDIDYAECWKKYFLKEALE